MDFLLEFCVELFVGCGIFQLAVMLCWYFPLPLRSTGRFTFGALKCSPLPVSASPACLSSIPFIRTHICFVSPSKTSFALLTTSFHIPLFSTSIILAPALSFYRSLSYLCLPTAGKEQAISSWNSCCFSFTSGFLFSSCTISTAPI